jgi:hypothetical protein
MIMKLRNKLSCITLAILLVLIWLGGGCSVRTRVPGAGEITVKQLDDRLRVEIDGELFTEYLFCVKNRPVLYPVVGPYGIGMTRNFPMKKNVPGEQQDHPWHTSIWYGHWPVNGINFFTLPPDAGRIEHGKVLETQSGLGKASAKVNTRWIDPEGNIVLTDTRTLTFRLLGRARVIDWEITLHASNGEVTIGDADRGTMAIRTHPNLRLANNPKEGVTTANGRALNSEGITADAAAGANGGLVWGKRARWIDYWGQIDDKTVGIAILDHPANPRHPTHWMARGYGYIGACPFGLNSFEGKPLGTGDMKIPAGQSATFRYRFIFHEGSPTDADIEGQWRRYAGMSKPSTKSGS